MAPRQLRKEGGCLAPLARFWQKTYAADYIALSLLLTAYILIQYFIIPFHRMFTLDNVNIQYPYALHERVPVSWMFGFGGGLPLVVLIIWLITTRASAHKWHVTLLGLFFSLIFTSFITDVIKNEVGRPRPDLLSRCKPEAGTPEHSLVNIEVCTDPNYAKLQDGWRSFPSGHSSFAFSGLGFLALWLSGQLHVFRPYADLLKGLLALSPLLGAALIAISRCEDYRHDVYDVTVGSALGMTVAFFSYRRYFPRLTNMKCHEPLPSMADGKGVFDKVKLDEETGLQSANAFELDDLNSDEEP